TRSGCAASRPPLDRPRRRRHRRLTRVAKIEREVAPPKPPDDATAGDVVQLAVATSVAKLLRHDPGVRLGEDPEDLHQARVATRRLRSDLRTFRAVVDRTWGDGLRVQLKTVGDLYGAVRDTDVMIER